MKTRRRKGSIRENRALILIITMICVIVAGCDGIFIGDGGASSIGIGTLNAAAIQTDGKIVVAGEVDNPDGGTDLALARYNTDGTLDTTFGPAPGGIVITIIGGGASANGLVLQPDGKIIVAGEALNLNTNSFDFVLARYNTDGTLDSTFGPDFNGTVTTAINTSVGVDSAGANALVLQPDGKIVVTGEVLTATTGSFDFVLVRYNTTGTLDPGFGPGGIVTTTIGGGASANALVLQADGKIVVAGEALNNVSGFLDFALARYNVDGTLDTSFGPLPGGIVTTPIDFGTDSASALVLQADGKIVVAGGSQVNVLAGGNRFEFALARYSVNGRLDTTFGPGGNGLVTTEIGGCCAGIGSFASALELQPDGKIVVTGSAGIDFGLPPVNFALVRYTTAGVIDTTFGPPFSGGIITTPIGSGGFDFASALARQQDGKIVVVGDADTFLGGIDFALARYFPDGILDPTFGTLGIVTTTP